MDKMASRLRDDADRIECKVSDELDRRIRASLESVTPETGGGRGSRRPAVFWWASSLTGVAAAVAIVALINLPGAKPPPTPVKPLVLPDIELRVRTAELTTPLEREMDDLQSDLKKAQGVVRQDIDRLF